jgi:hypothetical protein
MAICASVWPRRAAMSLSAPMRATFSSESSGWLSDPPFAARAS